MDVSLIASILWAAGFLLNAALLFVLLFRKRYRVVPWFTTWIAFAILFTVVLFFSYRYSSKHVYANLYWSWAFVDLFFQVAVVFEIARGVLRRGGRWIEGARVRLLAMGIIAPVIALIMAISMKPAAIRPLDAIEARGSLFTTLLICLLFTGTMLASQQLGLGWGGLVMREGYGLTIWTLVAFVTDTLHAYWRTVEHFTALEHVRMVFYLGSLLYWTIAFWLPEREPVEADTATIKRLTALHDGLK